MRERRTRAVMGWMISSMCMMIGACTNQVDTEDATPTPRAQGPTWSVQESPTKPDAETPVTAASREVEFIASPQKKPFVVHEWGTYTSVQGANGETLDGMMREEEPLPAFVHARDPKRLRTKGFESLPEQINQKLETPVIYFYGEPDRKVRVEVDFPQGVISEWYPQAASFQPAIGAIRSISEGKMSWEGELLSREPRQIEVKPDEIWAPSRQVDALPFAVGEEEERFIFYRGLGRFEMPVRTRSVSGDAFTITNESDETIPAVIVLHVSEHGGTVKNLGALEAGGSLRASPTPKEMPLSNYEEAAHHQVKEALVASGLYEDEALAMVNTWRRSYFKTPGTRVLYVAPRSWTDKLLPLSISPQPDEVVRTLVGRIEVMTARDEASALRQLEASANAGEAAEVTLERMGRFADPRLRRLCPMLEDPGVVKHCLQVQRHAFEQSFHPGEAP